MLLTIHRSYNTACRGKYYFKQFKQYLWCFIDKVMTEYSWCDEPHLLWPLITEPLSAAESWTVVTGWSWWDLSHTSHLCLTTRIMKMIAQLWQYKKEKNKNLTLIKTKNYSWNLFKISTCLGFGYYCRRADCRVCLCRHVHSSSFVFKKTI